MSKLGEMVLRHLSRDPAQPDYLVDHYQLRHGDINASVLNLKREFPTIGVQIKGGKVLDIGCAEGLEAIALSRIGAKEVIGIDILIDPKSSQRHRQEHAPDSAIELRCGDAHKIQFSDNTFDAVVSMSAFEHFRDPYVVLKEGIRVLKPGGRFFITSGVWAHPYGAHMHFFTKLPWVHFVFSENTIMSVRKLYRDDGAIRFHEVKGGLNKVGVRLFKRFINELNIDLEYFRLEPIRKLGVLTRIPFLNELFTNLIVAVVRKPVM